MTHSAPRDMDAGWDSEQFLAVVSHELRTPTAAIIGWAEMLCRNSTDGEVLARGVEVISRNAHLLARLIEQLMDFSRVRAGCVNLEFRAVALAPVLLAVIETMTPLASRKSIRIVAELDSSADHVCGDPACLQQVFTNLLSNAVKFSPEGGRVRVWLARRDDRAEVSVSDNGRGISRDFLPHVFDPFRQGHDSLLNREGLGLGLAIVRHLVERHGGEISAESPGEGQGATFTVSLPVGDRAAGV